MWQVLLLSAAPIFELRGGLPLALALGMEPWSAYFIAVAGNLLPVPALVWGLRRLLSVFPRLPGRAGSTVGRYLAWQEGRFRPHYARLGDLALILLVALPSPFTGAWTGAVVATLLGILPQRALPLITIGVLIAGIVVLLASLGIFGFLS